MRVRSPRSVTVVVVGGDGKDAVVDFDAEGSEHGEGE